MDEEIIMTPDSLFDQQIRSSRQDSLSELFPNETIESTVEPQPDSSIASMIDLNRLTGEISFKKRIDYEELVNKVLNKS